MIFNPPFHFHIFFFVFRGRGNNERRIKVVFSRTGFLEPGHYPGFTLFFSVITFLSRGRESCVVMSKNDGVKAIVHVIGVVCARDRGPVCTIQ